MEIGVKLYAKMGDSSYDDIPVLCMLILDGKMIPFSIDGDENKALHTLTIKNAAEGMHSVIFTPYGVSGQTPKQLLFMAIPFYDKKEVTIFENDILACQKKIISEGGELPPEIYEPGSGYIFTEDLYSIWVSNFFGGFCNNYGGWFNTFQNNNNKFGGCLLTYHHFYAILMIARTITFFMVLFGRYYVKG